MIIRANYALIYHFSTLRQGAPPRGLAAAPAIAEPPPTSLEASIVARLLT